MTLSFSISVSSDILVRFGNYCHGGLLSQKVFFPLPFSCISAKDWSYFLPEMFTEFTSETTLHSDN